MRVTKVAGCIIRQATAKDVELVLSFIKRLAQYEKLEDQVTVTLETLYDSLFVKKAAKAIIAELQGMPVGFAVYFHNFSTFLGKPGLYLGGAGNARQGYRQGAAVLSRAGGCGAGPAPHGVDLPELEHPLA